MPLTILARRAGTEALVLEMAMRGPGQIDELARIAEPDVGCIVNVGPVHLEQLGSVEAVAAAKAELIAGTRPARDRRGARRTSRCSTPHIRSDIATITLRPGRRRPPAR